MNVFPFLVVLWIKPKKGRQCCALSYVLLFYIVVCSRTCVRLICIVKSVQ